MKVSVEPGKYIVAVSGGVDSVVLLDLLSQDKSLELIVAHFDHGIRKDSAEDRKFVQELAKKYDLSFEHAEGKLGPKASEATARVARYKFLEETQKKHKANSIVTAHHQDDILETMLINMMRGTNRKGLSPMQKTGIIRPLLAFSKKDILDYAKSNKLIWHEDSTNVDTVYLRNWLRHKVIPKLSTEQKKQLVSTNTKLKTLNVEIDSLLESEFKTDQPELQKSVIINMPHNVAQEIMANWLRHNDILNFDKQTIERLVIKAKTLPPGKQVEIKNNKKLLITAKTLTIKT